MTLKTLDTVGYWIGFLAARVVGLKVGWWLLGMEGWCGLGLTWDAALFLALVTIRPTSVKNFLMTPPPATRLEFDPRLN